MSIRISNQHTCSNLYIIANYDAVVNLDACATHTNIIANAKLCTWLYVHSTLQIARHRIHRITRGEVKVIPY